MQPSFVAFLATVSSSKSHCAVFLRGDTPLTSRLPWSGWMNSIGLRLAIDPRTFYESNSVLRGGHKGLNANPLHTSNCIVRHGADGTGKMRPPIVGKDMVYKQMLTEPGMFAIIYGGPVVPSPRHEAR
jgi:hypothetical protein